MADASRDNKSGDAAATSQSSTQRQRIIELAKLFTRLGFTAFGGPVAHIAMIEDEVVVRRRWIDRQHFLDLVASVNFIPGPNSTELVILLGLLRGGYPGLMVAGFCFILPAMLIILPLGWLYVSYGAVPTALPILSGIGAVVAAIVAVATIRLMRTALRTGARAFSARTGRSRAGGRLRLAQFLVQHTAARIEVAGCCAAADRLRAGGRGRDGAFLLESRGHAFWQRLRAGQLFAERAGG
jgi:chromate transport protein ChrA